MPNSDLGSCISLDPKLIPWIRIPKPEINWGSPSILDFYLAGKAFQSYTTFRVISQVTHNSGWIKTFYKQIPRELQLYPSIWPYRPSQSNPKGYKLDQNISLSSDFWYLLVTRVADEISLSRNFAKYFFRISRNKIFILRNFASRNSTKFRETSRKFFDEIEVCTG
jgi:hypothetical protein